MTWEELATKITVTLGTLAAIGGAFIWARKEWEKSSKFREGVTALSSLPEKIDSILQEVRPDGGNSLRDKVEGIGASLKTYIQLSDSRFRFMADTAGILMFEHDKDGLCVWVSDGWCALTGMQREDAIGNGWVNAVAASDRPRVMEAWRRAVIEKRVFSEVYKYVCNEMGTVRVKVRVEPMYGADDQIAGFIGSVQQK